MAEDKKLVEAITSMEEDFAQWYTDVVKKAELIEFIQDRVNVVLGYLGYPPLFEKEKGTISEQFYLNVSSFKSSDFFANTQLQYKRNWSRYKLKFNTGTENE